MNSPELDALTIQKMASGHLCLNLSERVAWEGFPDFAEKFLQATGGEIVKKTDGPDMRLWNVRIDESDLILAFDDFPVMISLESLDRAGDTVIERLEQQLSREAN